MTKETRKILIGFGFGLLLFLLAAYTFSNIFIYFVIALIISAILRPMVNRLHSFQFFSLRIPRFIAVLISFAVLLSFVFLFIAMFIPLVTDQIAVLIRLDYQSVLNRIAEPLGNLEQFLIEYRIVKAEPGFFVANLWTSLENLFADIKINSIINSIIAFTGNVSVGILAVSFISFFLLYEKGLIRKQAISLIPNQYFEVTIAAVSKIEKLLSNYLIGLLFQMVSIFSLASIGLSFIGVNYAIVIGLFAAVANLIPYAGPILGATFGIFVSISTNPVAFGSPEFYFLIIKILAVFGLVQLTDNIVLQPLIFSRSVKVHPLEIFVIIFAGATLGGIPGMIAAIPVYTIIRVSVIEFAGAYRAYRIFKI
jgi:predicted PurR-regulated permease PerM